jgi:hypothetical protein
MAKRSVIRKLGSIDLSREEATQFENQIEIAEADLAQSRVNFRWGPKQLNLVKTAATLMGIPYQTYMKQVLYRQALADFKEHMSVLSASGPRQQQDNTGEPAR